MNAETTTTQSEQRVRTQPFPARAPFGDEEIALVSEALRAQTLFCHSGKMTPRFEAKFAALYGVKHAYASSSGTAAIHSAIGALDLKPGDEVITAPITDGGTIIGILYEDAVPVFAEVDPRTFCMDPADVERKITPRTRAILVVHLFGSACDMDAMQQIASRHKLSLIEDCSQAHCTRYKGGLLGTLGDIGCFSLQQSKHMTTGDGGVVITNNPELAQRLNLFRDKGWSRESHFGPRRYRFLAPNYRITELQSAVGLAQLGKIESVIARRNQHGDALTARLADIPGLHAAPRTPGSSHSYWKYPVVVESGRAEDWSLRLQAQGIPAYPHYTGLPIYACMEEAMYTPAVLDCFAEQARGGGPSRYDLSTTTPRTVQAMKNLLTIEFNESYGPQEVDDIARAVHLVAGQIS